jgi:GntR family transcriptional regulator of arabinose operon
MEELDIRTVAKDAEHSPSQVKRPIGLIIPDIEDFFALRLIQGVNAILKDTEFYLTIALSNHSKELEKEAIVQFVHRGVEGLIIFPIDAETYNDEILSLKVNNFPFVLIDRYLPGVETNFVCSDNRKGTRLAVSHLWELGHREIAICSDTPVQTVTVDERISGYMDTLRQKGAMINPSLILTEFKVNYDDADEQHVLYRYIKNRLATAYITLNGRLGMHIANIARKLNMNIGEDISILTFDNPSPLIDRQGAFTHIAQSESEIGRRSAKILIDILRTPDTRKDYNKVVLEPELVIGKSTGTAPKTAAK